MVIDFVLLSSILSLTIVFILFIFSGSKDILDNSFFKAMNNAHWVFLDSIVFAANLMLRNSLF